MNYQELINQSIGNVYQAGIATKILQHMGRIRNSSDTNQARRWVMELLQNARDVAWKDEMVKVKIELTDRELKFSHTGKPFRVKDILSIVNQVSSKVDDENTVGQFGTGFVTTFQLSEQVCLEGVLKEEGLPYKAFKINIDRQGDTKDEILTSIERAMDALREVDATSEIANYDKNAFNTTFTYVLKEENNRTIAKIGMEDLKETIFFVLLFSKKIGSVELKYALEGKEKTVCYTQGVHKKVGEKLCTAEFFCTGENNEKQKYEICYMEKDGMTLAANYCEEQGFLPISENCARIFIDFPLVGAEKFCFPVVINNLKLQPNEPRSGISLVDNANSKDAQINKELMKEAVECYREFLGEAHQLSFQGLEHIIKIPFYEYSKEMSEQWVKCNIYKKIYKFCASLPILKTSAGMKPLNHAEVYLLKAKTPEFLEELKEVLHPIANMYYSMDDVDWYRTFEAYEPLEEKIYSLEKLLDEEENLIRSEGKVDIQKISIVKWCEAICKFALKDEELSRKIRAGELAVFPTQKLQDGKVWYLKKMQEICIDPKIPEILKDVTEILDNMPHYDLSITTQNCCIREHLLHKDFVLEEFSGLMTYEWSRLGNYIEAKSSETFKIADYRNKPVIYKNMRKNVWKLMVSCGPDKEMYDMFVQFSDEEIPEYEFFETPLSNRVWKNTYHGLLILCVDEICKAKKLENLRWYRSAKCLDIYAWMNLFYKKWSAYQYVNEDYGWEIYLNQEGNFRLKSELMWDKITAKELKSIAYGLRELSLNCNYYQKLVHEKIEESTLYFQICKDANIAVTINQTVTQLLAQKNLADASMEQQEACSLLLAWIQNNEILQHIAVKKGL